MSLKRFFIKTTAFLTLILFSAQTLFAQSVEVMRLPSGSSEISVLETASWLPSDIAKAEKVSGKNPSVFLIQDPHGQEQGQRNIEKLLELLRKHTGFKTLLLEGGVGEQDPSLLDWFSEDRLNQKAAEILLHESQIGGPELFLRKHRDVKSWGAEDLEPYIQNLEMYQQVINQKDQTEKYIQGAIRKLKTQASAKLNPKLYDFFKLWLSYEHQEISFAAFLSALQKYAQETLEIHLSDPREQLAWPMLVRYAEIARREPLIQSERVLRDRERLKKWANGQQLAFEEKKDMTERRAFWEQFYTKAASRGFEFKQYPDLALFEGYQILRAELDAKTFLDEVEKLRGQLLQALIQNQALESPVLAQAKSLLFFKKLFQLELTPEEFERAKDHRLQTVDQRLKEIHLRAMEFYQTAVKRDDIMARTIMQFLAAEGDKGQGSRRAQERSEHGRDVPKAGPAAPPIVVIAGGFHTPGLTQKLEDKGISYAVLSPHLTDLQSSGAYQDAMMGKSRPIDFGRFKNRVPSMMTPVDAWRGKLPQSLVSSRTRLKNEILTVLSPSRRSETRIYKLAEKLGEKLIESGSEIYGDVTDALDFGLWWKKGAGRLGSKSTPNGFVAGNWLILDSSFKPQVEPLLIGELEELKPHLIYREDFLKLYQYEWKEFLFEYTIPIARAIESLDLSGKTVLDLGAADGLLGLMALKKGAKRVLSVEIDPKQREIFQKHLAANGFSKDQSVFVQADIWDGKKAIDKIEGIEQVDAVFANIGEHTLIYKPGTHLQAADWLEFLPNAEFYVAGGYLPNRKQDRQDKNFKDIIRALNRKGFFEASRFSVYSGPAAVIFQKQTKRSETRSREELKISQEIKSVRVKHHGRLLSFLRNRAVREGTVPFLINLSEFEGAHAGDKEIITQEDRISEKNWASQALIQKFIQFYVHVPPSFRAHSVINQPRIPTVWTLRKRAYRFWEKPSVTRLSPSEASALLTNLQGERAIAAADAAAYWLDDKAEGKIYVPGPDGFGVHSKPVKDFLSQYLFPLESTLYFVESSGDETHARHLPEGVQLEDLQKLEEHLHQLLVPFIQTAASQRVFSEKMKKILRAQKLYPQAAFLETMSQKTMEEITAPLEAKTQDADLVLEMADYVSKYRVLNDGSSIVLKSTQGSYEAVLVDIFESLLQREPILKIYRKFMKRRGILGTGVLLAVAGPSSAFQIAPGFDPWIHLTTEQALRQLDVYNKHFPILQGQPVQLIAQLPKGNLKEHYAGSLAQLVDKKRKPELPGEMIRDPFSETSSGVLDDFSDIQQNLVATEIMNRVLAGDFSGFKRLIGGALLSFRHQVAPNIHQMINRRVGDWLDPNSLYAYKPSSSNYSKRSQYIMNPWNAVLRAVMDGRTNLGDLRESEVAALVAQIQSGKGALVEAAGHYFQRRVSEYALSNFAHLDLARKEAEERRIQKKREQQALNETAQKIENEAVLGFYESIYTPEELGILKDELSRLNEAALSIDKFDASTIPAITSSLIQKINRIELLRLDHGDDTEELKWLFRRLNEELLWDRADYQAVVKAFPADFPFLTRFFEAKKKPSKLFQTRKRSEAREKNQENNLRIPRKLPVSLQAEDVRGIKNALLIKVLNEILNRVHAANPWHLLINVRVYEAAFWKNILAAFSAEFLLFLVFFPPYISGGFAVFSFIVRKEKIPGVFRDLWLTLSAINAINILESAESRNANEVEYTRLKVIKLLWQNLFHHDRKIRNIAYVTIRDLDLKEGNPIRESLETYENSLAEQGFIYPWLVPYRRSEVRPEGLVPSGQQNRFEPGRSETRTAEETAEEIIRKRKTSDQSSTDIARFSSIYDVLRILEKKDKAKEWMIDWFYPVAATENGVMISSIEADEEEDTVRWTWLSLEEAQRQIQERLAKAQEALEAAASRAEDGGPAEVELKDKEEARARKMSVSYSEEQQSLIARMGLLSYSDTLAEIREHTEKMKIFRGNPLKLGVRIHWDNAMQRYHLAIFPQGDIPSNEFRSEVRSETRNTERGEAGERAVEKFEKELWDLLSQISRLAPGAENAGKVLGNQLGKMFTNIPEGMDEEHPVARAVAFLKEKKIFVVSPNVLNVKEVASTASRYWSGLDADERTPEVPFAALPEASAEWAEYRKQFNLFWRHKNSTNIGQLISPAISSHEIGNSENPVKFLSAAIQAGFESAVRPWPELIQLIMKNGVESISLVKKNKAGQVFLKIRFKKPYQISFESNARRELLAAVLKDAPPKLDYANPERYPDLSEILENGEAYLQPLTFEAADSGDRKGRVFEEFFELIFSGKVFPLAGHSFYSKEGIARMADVLGRTEEEKSAIAQDLRNTLERELEKKQYAREPLNLENQKSIQKKIDQWKQVNQVFSEFDAENAAGVRGAFQRAEMLKKYMPAMLSLRDAGLFPGVINFTLLSGKEANWILSESDIGDYLKRLTGFSTLLEQAAPKLKQMEASFSSPEQKTAFLMEFNLALLKVLPKNPSKPFQKTKMPDARKAVMEFFQGFEDIPEGWMSPSLALLEKSQQKGTENPEEKTEQEIRSQIARPLEDRAATEMLKTIEAFEAVSQQSSLTVPPDLKLDSLEAFEKSAAELAGWTRNYFEPQSELPRVKFWKTSYHLRLLAEQFPSEGNALYAKLSSAAAGLTADQKKEFMDVYSATIEEFGLLAMTLAENLQAEGKLSEAAALADKITKAFKGIAVWTGEFEKLKADIQASLRKQQKGELASDDPVKRAAAVQSQYSGEISKDENRLIREFLDHVVRSADYPKISKLKGHLQAEQKKYLILDELQNHALALVKMIETKRSEVRSTGEILNSKGYEKLEGGKIYPPHDAEAEQLDLLDKNGLPLNASPKSRDQVHRDGDWHQTVHIYIRDSRGRLLFQQRSSELKQSPGVLQIAVSGHVAAGHTVKETLLKESLEELGLNLEKSRLEEGGRLKKSTMLASGGMNNEFAHVYFYTVTDEEIQQIQRNFNLHEMDRLWWVPFKDLPILARETPEIFSHSILAALKSDALYESLSRFMRSETRLDQEAEDKPSQALEDAKDILFQTIDWLLQIKYPYPDVLEDYRMAVRNAKEARPYDSAWIGKEYGGMSGETVFIKSQELITLGQALMLLQSQDAMVEMLAAVVVREAWGYRNAMKWRNEIGDAMAKGGEIFKSPERQAILPKSNLLKNEQLGVFLQKFGAEIQNIVEVLLSFEVYEDLREYEFLTIAAKYNLYQPDRIDQALASHPAVNLQGERKGKTIYLTRGDVSALLQRTWAYFSKQALQSSPEQRRGDLSMDAFFFHTLHAVREGKIVFSDLVNRSSGQAVFLVSAKALLPKIEARVEEMQKRSETRKAVELLPEEKEKLEFVRQKLKLFMDNVRDQLGTISTRLGILHGLRTVQKIKLSDLKTLQDFEDLKKDLESTAAVWDLFVTSPVNSLNQIGFELRGDYLSWHIASALVEASKDKEFNEQIQQGVKEQLNQFKSVVEDFGSLTEAVALRLKKSRSEVRGEQSLQELIRAWTEIKKQNYQGPWTAEHPARAFLKHLYDQSVSTASEETQDFLLYVLMDEKMEVRREVINFMLGIGPDAKPLIPLEKLLEHLREPWKSLQGVETPYTAPGKTFSRALAIHNKRLAILSYFAGSQEYLELSPRQVVAEFLKEQLKTEVSEFLADETMRSEQTLQAVQSGTSSFLAEEKPLSFFEVFARTYLRKEFEKIEGTHKETWLSTVLYSAFPKFQSPEGQRILMNLARSIQEVRSETRDSEKVNYLSDISIENARLALKVFDSQKRLDLLLSDSLWHGSNSTSLPDVFSQMALKSKTELRNAGTMLWAITEQTKLNENYVSLGSFDSLEFLPMYAKNRPMWQFEGAEQRLAEAAQEVQRIGYTNIGMRDGKMIENTLYVYKGSPWFQDEEKRIQTWEKWQLESPEKITQLQELFARQFPVIFYFKKRETGPSLRYADSGIRNERIQRGQLPFNDPAVSWESIMVPKGHLEEAKQMIRDYAPVAYKDKLTALLDPSYESVLAFNKLVVGRIFLSLITKYQRGTLAGDNLMKLKFLESKAGRAGLLAEIRAMLEAHIAEKARSLKASSNSADSGTASDGSGEARSEMRGSDESVKIYQEVQGIVRNFRENFPLLDQALEHIDHQAEWLTRHFERVSQISIELGSRLWKEESPGTRKKKLLELGVAAYLHDIGKSLWDPNFINNSMSFPSPLEMEKKTSEEEKDRWKQWRKWIEAHPQDGRDFLDQLGGYMFESHGLSKEAILQGVMDHHENEDGTGYPRKLSGDTISEYGKLIHLVDSFDAAKAKRSYSAAMSTPEVFEFLQKKAGLFYNKKYVETFTAPAFRKFLERFYQPAAGWEFEYDSGVFVGSLKGEEITEPRGLLEGLRKQFPAENKHNMVVLDLGSYKGRTSEWIVGQGFSALGLEKVPGHAFAAYLSAWRNKHAVLDSNLKPAQAVSQMMTASKPSLAYGIQDITENLPLPDASVHGVVLHRVVSTLLSDEQIQRMMKEIYRVLKPGGQISLLDYVRRDDVSDPEHAVYQERYAQHKKAIRILEEYGYLKDAEEGLHEMLSDPESSPLLVTRTKEGSKHDDSELSGQELADAIIQGKVQIQFIVFHPSEAKLHTYLRAAGLAVILSEKSGIAYAPGKEAKLIKLTAEKPGIRRSEIREEAKTAFAGEIRLDEVLRRAPSVGEREGLGKIVEMRAIRFRMMPKQKEQLARDIFVIYQKAFNGITEYSEAKWLEFLNDDSKQTLIAVNSRGAVRGVLLSGTAQNFRSNQKEAVILSFFTAEQKIGWGTFMLDTFFEELSKNPPSLLRWRSSASAYSTYENYLKKRGIAFDVNARSIFRVQKEALASFFSPNAASAGRSEVRNKNKKFELETAVTHTLNLFKTEPSRMKLPSQVELSKALGPSQMTFARHYSEILKGLEERLRVEEDALLADRIRQAVVKKFRQMESVKSAERFDLSRTIEHVIDLFKTDPSRMDLPNQTEFSGSFGLSHTTFSTHYSEILEGLEERMKFEEDKALTDRIRQAAAKKRRQMEFRKDFDLNGTIEHVIQLFKKESSRIKLPAQKELSMALGPNRTTFLKHYSEILEGLEEKMKLEEDKVLSNRIKQGIAEKRRQMESREHFDFNRTLEHVIHLFKMEPSRMKLPTQAEFSEALGPNQMTFSNHYVEILEGLEERMKLEEDETLADRIRQAIAEKRHQMKSAKPTEHFDLSRTLKYVIHSFKMGPLRMELPSQKELSKALGPDQKTFSRHYAEILKGLEERMKSEEDEGLKIRILQAAEKYRSKKRSEIRSSRFDMKIEKNQAGSLLTIGAYQIRFDAGNAAAVLLPDGKSKVIEDAFFAAYLKELYQYAESILSSAAPAPGEKPVLRILFEIHPGLGIRVVDPMARDFRFSFENGSVGSPQIYPAMPFEKTRNETINNAMRLFFLEDVLDEKSRQEALDIYYQHRFPNTLLAFLSRPRSETRDEDKDIPLATQEQRAALDKLARIIDQEAKGDEVYLQRLLSPQNVTALARRELLILKALFPGQSAEEISQLVARVIRGEKINLRSELRVGEDMTARILRVGSEIFDQLFPKAFATETPKTLSSVEKENHTKLYTTLLQGGGKIVLPASVFEALENETLADYFEPLLRAARKMEFTKPSVYVAGDKESKLKNFLFSNGFAAKFPDLVVIAPRVVQISALKETDILRQLEKEAASVSFAGTPAGENESVKVPALLWDTEALAQRNASEKIEYLHRMTQLQFLIADQLKNQPGDRFKLTGELLGKLGVLYTLGASGLPQPEVSSLLSEAVGDMLAQQLIAKSA